VLGDRRGEKMSLREKNGEEFDQVEVALIHNVELHVPDEFGVGGHVVVSDHAAVPPAAELHADVSSDEMARVRGGGVTFDSSRPMGQRGWRWWEMGGEALQPLPQWALSWGESTGGHLNGVPSYLSPRT
jgi:hypothetical protein